jgi:hypothetical protein
LLRCCHYIFFLSILLNITLQMTGSCAGHAATCLTRSRERTQAEKKAMSGQHSILFSPSSFSFANIFFYSDHYLLRFLLLTSYVLDMCFAFTRVLKSYAGLSRHDLDDYSECCSEGVSPLYMLLGGEERRW